MPIYLPDDRFNALAIAIADQRPCAFAGRVTPDQVMIILAEIGGARLLR